MVQGDMGRARDFIHKGLSFDSGNPNGLYIEADIELLSRNYQVASEMYSKCVEIPVRLGDFSLHSSSTGLGFSLLKLGKHAEGLKYLEQSRLNQQAAIAQGSEAPIIRHELAVISAAKGSPPTHSTGFKKRLISAGATSVTRSSIRCWRAFGPMNASSVSHRYNDKG